MSPACRVGVRLWRVTAVVTVTLAALGCRSSARWSAMAPDHRTTVTVSSRGGRSCVVVATRRDACVDGMAVRTLAFDSSGAHVAYAARVGDRWTVVRDGISGARWDGVGAPRLSRDGARLAYPALENGRWRVVVDGVAGDAFDAILSGTLTFDPTGRRVVYAASRGDSVHVVVDGVTSPGWSGVGRLALDGEGAHVAYAARRGVRWRVIVDDQPGPEHDEIGQVVLGSASVLRGDGADGADSRAAMRLAYAARDSARWRVVAEGNPSEPFDAVRALVHPPNGEAIAFIARLGEREGVVRGGRIEGWHDSVEPPAFSPDGRWGYVARDGDSVSVIVDGRVAARAPGITDLVFGRGGRQAYVTGEGERMVVVDEQTRHAFDLVVTGTLQFVGGGTVWACLAGDRVRRELFVVVDGVRVGRPFDWSEIVRQMQDGDGAAAVRAWVVAEAERAIGTTKAR